MITAATIVAPTATGEWRKLHTRSPSANRRSRPGVVVAALASSDTGGTFAVDPETRIDDIIQEVDNQVDHHEYEADQHEIGGHHRDVGETDRLDEHQPHAGPLKHRLGD